MRFLLVKAMEYILMCNLKRQFFSAIDPPLNYSAMPLEEKRKHYFCGNKYVTASSEDLPRWDSEHDSVERSKLVLDITALQKLMI